MLFDPSCHEPLRGSWDEAAARRAIAAIAADAEASYDSAQLWPGHPRDDGDRRRNERVTAQYHGAAGVITALLLLGEAGLVRLQRDWTAELASLEPQRGAGPAWLFGSTGIWTPLYRRTRDAGLAERIETAVARHLESKASELFWGLPGSMLAPLFLHEWTGEACWRELGLRCAAALRGRWHHREQLGCRFWVQHLWGGRERYVGAAHGQLGALYALLRAAPLFDEASAVEVRRDAARAALTLAVREEGLANWPVFPGAARGRWAVQWCHGAPGGILGLAPMPVGLDAELEALLLEAGELVWRAGPLIKGHMLCHGTAGNGCALLELHRRTGDLRWLERARAFAGHAVEQYERIRAEWGRGWYSLWTGDLGLALYLAQCIEGRAGMPGLDSI